MIGGAAWARRGRGRTGSLRAPWGGPLTGRESVGACEGEKPQLSRGGVAESARKKIGVIVAQALGAASALFVCRAGAGPPRSIRRLVQKNTNRGDEFRGAACRTMRCAKSRQRPAAACATGERVDETCFLTAPAGLDGGGTDRAGDTYGNAPA